MPRLRKMSKHPRILWKLKKMSKKCLKYQKFKSPILAVLAIAAFFCFIFSDKLTSDESAYSKVGEYLMKIPKKAVAYKTVPGTSSLQKVQEVVESDPMIPPQNVTEDERIQWFRRKLPELEILNSTELSKRFHGRVLELFNNNCSAQFFMIWLSNAKSFGSREFLAVDSLFSIHPKGCLSILSHSMDSPQGYNILKPLHDRGLSVLAVTPDIPFLVQGTPAESWFDTLKNGYMDPGSVPLFSHLTNLIKLTVLYKYGGIYLDTDLIFLKDMSGLRNTVGAQSIDRATKKWTRLNGAVMVFDIYHPLLVEFLHEYSTTFNGNKWGHNGAYLVSRVIRRLGNRKEYNLTILPPKAFYPVDWVRILKLYKKPETNGERNWVEDTVKDISSKSYVLHLWNKVNRDMKVEEGSAMEKLISTHCIVCNDIYNC